MIFVSKRMYVPSDSAFLSSVAFDDSSVLWNGRALAKRTNEQSTATTIVFENITTALIETAV